MPGYISEFQYVGGTSVEFIEVAIPAGTNVSGYSIEIYNSDGTVAHTNTFGSPVTTYAGQDIYVIDNGTAGYSDLTHGQAIALVDDLGDALSRPEVGQLPPVAEDSHGGAGVPEVALEADLDALLARQAGRVDDGRVG